MIQILVQIKIQTSTLTTAHTNITQPSQTQQPSPRNYDPPPFPPQYATHNNLHNSPPQKSSDTNDPDTSQVQPAVQFQIITPRTQPISQTLTYTPAQNTQTQNIQPGLTSITLHSNTLSVIITARILYRPPLQTIPTDPLSFRLTSTNPNSTQHSTTKNNQFVFLDQ